MDDFSQLDPIPVTYQALTDFFQKLGQANPYFLRKETISRIEKITGRPLVCYVSKTHNLHPAIPAYIDDSDLTGFSDLVHSVQTDKVDIFLISNGGSPEATERIVQLLRKKFKNIRFIIPSNAFSAATLMCFSGDEIVMDLSATLGPIDPQINGIPARAILRAFETVEKRLKKEGPQGLTAYMPLISKYDLHIFEICKSAQKLSQELAKNWLKTYMLKESGNKGKIEKIVRFFLNYDAHKSHGRSIDRNRAKELGLKVMGIEEISGLEGLVRSLYNQYELWFEVSPFYKVFEDSKGINWGRQSQRVTLQMPLFAPVGMPQPGPPDSLQ